MEDIEDRFRRSYWAVVHSVDTLRLRAWEERGLTLPQLRILFLLRANPGITTNVLARRLRLTVPTVSGLVDKLSRAGLVERGQREDDRRVIPLTLTKEGEATAGQIRDINRAYMHDIAMSLGGDIGSITESLEGLAAAIDRFDARKAEEDTGVS